MKEQTINLAELIKEIPFEKICKNIPLKILDSNNSVVWENDLSKDDTLKLFPLATKAGNILATLKTKEDYKGIIRKIIFRGIKSYLLNERKESDIDQMDVLFKDLNYISLKKKFDGANFNEKRNQEDILETLKMFRNYFPFEVINIYVKGNQNNLIELCEISTDGLKLNGEYWHFPLKDVAEFSFNTGSVYRSDDAKNDFYFGEQIETIKNKVINDFITMPLVYLNQKLGSITMYNFLGASKKFEKNYALKNFIQILSYKLFLGKNGKEVLEKKTSKRTLERFKGKEIPDYGKLKKNIKNAKHGEKRPILVMYGKINSFWENFHRVKLKTQANLLNYHYNIVSNIVNSYSGSIYQIQEESFIALWNYPADVEEYEKKAVLASIGLIQMAHDQIHLHWNSFGIKDFGFSLGLTKELVNFDEMKVGGKGFKSFQNNFIDTAIQLQGLAPNWTAHFHEKIITDLGKNNIVPMRKIFNLNLKREAQGSRVFAFKI